MLRSILRGLPTGSIAAAVVVVSALACSSGGSPSPSSPGPVDGSAPSDGSTTTDCSLVGCAPAPPCGQPCTAPCGCCADLTCSDAGPVVPDGGSQACGDPRLEWESDAGAACEDWVATHCCAEQAACANDSSCAKAVSCLNQCGPNGGANCFAPCPEDTSGLLAKLVSCTKTTPAGGTPIPAGCAWP